MARGDELNDAWLVHWLGCTQSEIINVYCNHKHTVHGDVFLAMKILTTVANMFSHQWQMIFHSVKMKPVTHALHTVGPGRVPTSTVHVLK
jgi:hypothetical protein